MNTNGSMVRALIVDDDPFSRSQVRKQLERYGDVVEIHAECASGEEGAHAIVTQKPDLVFLDIQMRGMDGFVAIRLWISTLACATSGSTPRL